MKKSVYLSAGVFVAICLWMVSGLFDGSADAKDQTAQTEKTLMQVRVARILADEVAYEVVVQGQLEPLRKVTVRAETAGLVIGLPVLKGRRVSKGEILALLDEEDRPAQLLKADAAVTSHQLEVEAAVKLRSQRLQTEQHLKSVEADLAESEADRASILLDIKRTKILAPFAGVLETRDVEIGSLVQRGDTIGELVDELILLAVGQVSQQDSSSLAMGQKVKVTLLDGRVREGTISYISRMAELGTRSFKVEAQIDNADADMIAGVSAELRITVAKQMAHFVSPAVLTLDSQGRVGVKTLDEDNRVEFQPISIVRTQTEGVWIEGLPNTTILITQGQGFVAEGEVVKPVSEET